MGNREWIYYEGFLSREECARVGLVISKFERVEISYDNLKEELSSIGIELVPLLKTARCFYTVNQVMKYNNHPINENIYSINLDGYILSSVRYQNVLVRYDRYMLECMAEYGDERSIKVLNELDKLEEVHTLCRRKRRN